MIRNKTAKIRFPVQPFFQEKPGEKQAVQKDACHDGEPGELYGKGGQNASQKDGYREKKCQEGPAGLEVFSFFRCWRRLVSTVQDKHFHILFFYR